MFLIAESVSTLGTDFLSDEGVIIGNLSVLFKSVAISNSVLRMGSPAYKESIVLEGGAVRIVTIPVAACRRESSIDIFEKVIYLEKKVTVLIWRCLCVIGK